MVSLKDRRNSGRYTPTITANPKVLKEENIEIPIEYDDWNDHRDGMRDWYRDGKMIKVVSHPFRRKTEYDIKREELNKKQKRLLKIRKARKNVKN